MAGFGRKSCRIPRLSLTAGVYTIRIAIVSCANLQPLALHGWAGEAQQFRIYSEATILDNALLALNAYFELETEWEVEM